MLQSYIACREHKHDIKDPNLSQEAHGHRDVSLPWLWDNSSTSIFFFRLLWENGKQLEKAFGENARRSFEDYEPGVGITEVG
jgi:hypothetical protein